MQKEPPKIEFPCQYSIRVIGNASQHFHSEVIEIVKIHAPDLDETKVKVKPSGKGNFSSVYLVIEATGVEQLSNLHEDLKKHPAVKMVI
ncbi:MAG: DUF493 domain-containing protein [Cellvibrionales bacterium]|nr:DUF493 domain-containing protein [Cellvibrionales bacterium]